MQVNCDKLQSEFTTLDSGKREDFTTGVRRNTQDDRLMLRILCPHCNRTFYHNSPAGSDITCECCALKFVVPGDLVTLDSGKREDFSTGARRDTQDAKPRYDLIPLPALKRLADLYARGAIKYGEHNWQKGMPFSRVYASLFRHLIQWAEGDTAEDHMAAVAWNAFALMTYEEWIREKKLLATLDDRGK